MGAADRSGAVRELIGDFTDRKPQDVAHQQDRALPRRQVLKCCHKSELCRLALVVDRLRTRCIVGDTVQKGVRIRLEPSDLIRWEPAGLQGAYVLTCVLVR
jgi:hypothetical protein